MLAVLWHYLHLIILSLGAAGFLIESLLALGTLDEVKFRSSGSVPRLTLNGTKFRLKARCWLSDRGRLSSKKTPLKFTWSLSFRFPCHETPKMLTVKFKAPKRYEDCDSPTALGTHFELPLTSYHILLSYILLYYTYYYIMHNMILYYIYLYSLS